MKSFIDKARLLLIEPRLQGEDDRRREFLANVVIVGSIGLVTLLTLTTIINVVNRGNNYAGIPLWSILSILGFLILCLVLSRKGHTTIASSAVVFLYGSGAIYETWKWGAELPETTLPYTLCIMLASILISSRAGWIVTGIIALNITIESYLEFNGLHHVDSDWKQAALDMGDAVEQIIIFGIIMLVSWLSTREIEKSLARAHMSEDILRKERDSLEETLAERTRELRQTQAAKMSHLYRFVEFGKFASGLFHDLMSPLSSVSLSIEELRNNHPHENKIIAKALKANEKMMRYVDGVRRQIHNRHVTETFSPASIIKDALLLIEHQARQQKTKIVFESKDEITQEHQEIIIYGNPIQFHQILINLISNALYACKHQPKRLIIIKLWEENNALKLSVSDTGCGMNADVITHIFEPFFSTKPNHEGTGLGLSTTKHIIEETFKGIISVQSLIDHGTTFTITLPTRLHETTISHSKSDSPVH